MKTAMLILEMFVYLVLAFAASFVAGGLVGYLALGGVPRAEAVRIAWTVCGVLFAVLGIAGRPIQSGR